MNELSASYADFILAVDYKELPSTVILQSKKLLLDLIGVSLAGYKLISLSNIVVEHTVASGGIPEATIFQTRGKYPAANVAFTNAALAHALDMDDGHRYAALHPGAVVIPAALAAAETVGASSQQVVEGIVCGYEVMIRLGMAINPSSLSRGFHSTGTVGPFGAVAAAAKIMKLDREQIVGAIGLAGLQGAGLLQVNHDEGAGGQAKLINSARASMSGMYSASLAKKGARGPSRILEGKDGFLGAFADEVRGELLTRELGSTFEILQTYLKFYASGRHSHACIDAAFQAFRDSGLTPDGIARVTVETYATAIRFTGITEVDTPSAARFSISFAIALALSKGDASADKFCEQNIADAAIQRLARKVEVSASEKWNSLYPAKRGATVQIFAHDGKSWTADIDLAKGEPESPASFDEIVAKFHANAGVQVARSQANALVDTIMTFDHLPLSRLMDLV